MPWKTMPWAVEPAPWTLGDTGRRVLARALRAVAARMGRWARALQAGRQRSPAPVRAPVLEFYAEAGAPEGALYADGEYVGRVEGVTRL
jgi:hypothetical protein